MAGSLKLCDHFRHVPYRVFQRKEFMIKALYKSTVTFTPTKWWHAISCIVQRRNLVSIVADGPCDAVCSLKSYQLLHETPLPQSECAMLRVTMYGQTRRPSKLRAVSVWQVDARAARRPSEVR